MKAAPPNAMSPARKRTVLFLICAAVLLAAGWAWGYSMAFDRFYGPSALLDRETVDLRFYSQLLHYADAGDQQREREAILRRFNQTSAYMNAVIATAEKRELSHEAAESIAQARAALKPQNQSFRQN
jgi:hypothetical protein